MSQQHSGYIYLIFNQKENKSYVGYHSGLPEQSKKYFGSGIIIKRKIKKHGKKFFKKIILGTIFAESKQELLKLLSEAEKETIWLFRTYGADGENYDEIYGYNLTKGGEGILGYAWTEEQKLNHKYIFKEQWKNREHPKGFLGNNHSKEAKQAISEKNKHPKYDKSNYKGSKKGVGIGIKRSEEFKNKMRVKMIGNNYGKGNKGSTGRVTSDETKMKLSQRSSGENNAMYGTTFVWYTNGIENKRCTDNNRFILEQKGFSKGKCSRA